MAARRRFRSRRIAAVVGTALLIAGIAVYAGGGVLAYEQQSTVHPHCGNPTMASQTPADFGIQHGVVANPPDLRPYRFSDYRDVEFPPRGDDLTLRGWYAPPSSTGGPAVILVHGYNTCRRDWNVLLPAGMLHRAGFGVLLLDLRNHGDSDSDGGRWAGGAKEYRDVLGAWDWLRAQGEPPSRIGIFGVSLGAATATIATGEEPAVAATWEDSGYASYDVAAAEFAETNGYPGWVADAAIPMGRMLGDPELATREPLREVRDHLGGRPFFIVHGLSDSTIRPHNAIELAIAVAAAGTPVEPWLVPSAEHTREMLLETDRYDERLTTFFASALGAP